MTSTTTLIAAARRISAQLAVRSNPGLAGLPQTLCQALKVQEEAGEMAQAVIGVLGQNPRKGVTHTWDQVIAEAIDVALTALVFAQTVIGDDQATLDDRLAFHLDRIQRRAAASGAPDVGASQPADGGSEDDCDRRMADTLRFVLETHTEHGLPLPSDIETSASTLRIDVGRDRPGDVRRWAARFGATMNPAREVDCNGSHWTDVSAKTSRTAGDAMFGWWAIEIRSVCNWRDRSVQDQPVTAGAVTA